MWAAGAGIDWGDARSLGIDIVTKVIEAVRRKHETDRIKFQFGDVTEDLRPADMLICKDVLQHLSNEPVHKFIRNNLKQGKYRWVILTNDCGSEKRDIPNMSYRKIDLAAPPFEVEGIIDLPIGFDNNETTKITLLPALTQ